MPLSPPPTRHPHHIPPETSIPPSPRVICRDCGDALTIRDVNCRVQDWYGEKRGFACTFPALVMAHGHCPDRPTSRDEKIALGRSPAQQQGG